jgi:hypothetical protein
VWNAEAKRGCQKTRGGGDADVEKNGKEMLDWKDSKWGCFENCRRRTLVKKLDQKYEEEMDRTCSKGWRFIERGYGEKKGRKESFMKTKKWDARWANSEFVQGYETQGTE